MTVPLRWRALGRLAWHGRGTRRHDDGRLWVALGDTAVDTLLIIRPVASKRGDRAVGLVEQGTDLRAALLHGSGRWRCRSSRSSRTTPHLPLGCPACPSS